MTLSRYWFIFHAQKDVLELPSALISLGCGITARDLDDAREIIQTYIFPGKQMPSIAGVVEHVRLESLERKHVLPNVGNPSIRGVWFPLGYSQHEPWWRLPPDGPNAIEEEDMRVLADLQANTQDGWTRQAGRHDV